jgi:hypothetical protein
MLHRATLVRTDVSEERSASNFRVTRISELGTTLLRFLQEPHGVTTQKTPFLGIHHSHRCENLISYRDF